MTKRGRGNSFRHLSGHSSTCLRCVLFLRAVQGSLEKGFKTPGGNGDSFRDSIETLSREISTSSRPFCGTFKRGKNSDLAKPQETSLAQGPRTAVACDVIEKKKGAGSQIRVTCDGARCRGCEGIRARKVLSCHELTIFKSEGTTRYVGERGRTLQ